MEPVDLVFFSVKAYDLESAARSAIDLVGPDTIVLAVQNGIDHHLRLRALLGTARVVPGIVYVSANVESPGVIHQLGGPGMIHFGKDRTGNVADQDLDRIDDALDAAGIGNVRHPEIDRELWHKFMFICAMSGVSALTRLTLRQIFDCLETSALYYDVMAEVAEVARASGVDLPESAPDQVMESLLASDALPERGSMAYDLMAGRRLELEMLNGTVVRLGYHQRGIQVPNNRIIYAALKPFASGAPAG
jgi:2-dehydropantoate 2-reductase